MKKFAVILDRDYENSPTCEIIESADFPDNLRNVDSYEPYGNYESISRQAYLINQLYPLILLSAENNQQMPAHICQLAQSSLT